VTEVDLGWSALGALAVISIACAAITLVAVRRFSNQADIARAKNLAQAHLLESRVYMDEPLLVLRSQRALLADQARLLALLGWPLLIASVPMLLLLGQLEALYGRAPLRPGEATVVTVKLGDADGEISLVAPADIAVETPPVHVSRSHEVSWRIRPMRPVSALLHFRAGGAEVTKSVLARWSVGYTSEHKAGSAYAFLIHPTELPDTHARWIEVRYPPATVLGLHWLVWFLLLTTVSGLLLRRPLGVAL
jgi:hypothetical protein